MFINSNDIISHGRISRKPVLGTHFPALPTHLKQLMVEFRVISSGIAVYSGQLNVDPSDIDLFTHKHTYTPGIPTSSDKTVQDSGSSVLEFPRLYNQ